MKSFKSLNTPRTLIRRLQNKDKEKLIALLCDKSVTRNMAFPDEMLTKEGISDLLEMTIGSYDSEKPFLSFSIIDINNGNFLGVTGYSPLADEEIEIFLAILPEHWNKGYATEICKALSDYAFESDEYKTIVAPVTQNNLASIKVVEKNGFTNYGLKKDPAYKDLIFIYKKIKDWAQQWL